MVLIVIEIIIMKMVDNEPEDSAAIVVVSFSWYFRFFIDFSE
jgi:hypothetical protein